MALRSEKKKLKKGKLNKQEDENDFFSAKDGSLRHSDLGGIDDFSKYRPVEALNEQNVRYESSAQSIPESIVTITKESLSKFALKDQQAASQINKDSSNSVLNAIQPPDLRSFKTVFNADINKLAIQKQKQVDLARAKEEATNAYKIIKQRRQDKNDEKAAASINSTTKKKIKTKHQNSSSHIATSNRDDFYNSSIFQESNHNREFY